MPSLLVYASTEKIMEDGENEKEKGVKKEEIKDNDAKRWGGVEKMGKPRPL